MNKRNYQRELEAIMGDPASKGKTVFLHSCCAPCSSYCMEYLCRVFRLTVFYYNPNIFPEEEYRLRAAEEKRLIEAYNAEIREGKREGFPIQIVEGEYHDDLLNGHVKKTWSDGRVEETEYVMGEPAGKPEERPD